MQIPRARLRILIALIISITAGLLPVNAADTQCLYDLQAVRTEIADVLNALSLQSGNNIVVGSDVKGQVTVQLKQVSFENALEYIVRMHGYDYRKEGSVYLVSAPDKLKASYLLSTASEPVSTEVYTVKYLSTEKLQATITSLSPGISIAIGPDTIIPALGTSSSSGSLSGSSSSGSSSSGGSTYESGTGSSTTTYRTSISNTIILKGPETLVRDALALVKRLDTPRSQVRIEVMILEINANAQDQLGVQWSWSKESMSESEQVTTGQSGSTVAGINFGFLHRSPMSFEATISAMITSGKGRILAKPNLSVLDCEKASILIGDKLLYPKLIGYTDNGNPIYDKEEEEVGIKLETVPKIGNDLITLSIYPQVSTVTSFKQIAGMSYPQISTREAQTTVRVRSGEQIAIGGLFREDEIATMSRIPLLADLPILGEFFKHRSITKTNTEIIIIITPQILSDSTLEANTP